MRALQDCVGEYYEQESHIGKVIGWSWAYKWGRCTPNQTGLLGRGQEPYDTKQQKKLDHQIVEEIPNLIACISNQLLQLLNCYGLVKKILWIDAPFV